MTLEGVASFQRRIFSPPSISFRRHPQSKAGPFNLRSICSYRASLLISGNVRFLGRNV